MTWTVDIGVIADNLNRDLDQVARAVKISLFNGVIRDTRVDTGRCSRDSAGSHETRHR